MDNQPTNTQRSPRLWRLALILLLSLTINLSQPVTSWAKGYIGKVVKVTKVDGRVLTGKVVEEDASKIVLQMPYGKATIRREQIKKIVNAEALIDEHKERLAKCKTGEDFYQLALWAQKKKLDRKLIRDDMEKAIKADPNHLGARTYLGYKRTPNGRGGWDWVYRREKKSRDKVSETITKNKDAIKERPWEEYEIVVRYPKNNPIYEIHSNCPEDLAVKYAAFMVKLKGGLTKLVQSISTKPIPWQNLGLAKIFICNSQKVFMEITGQRPGVGGFYTPGFFPAGEDSRCIVAFHGTFGASGDTYKVLAHEGTHQLQGRMWTGSFQSRPPWLIEGLAVYFGDGHKIDKSGKFTIGIPRDRLNALRRGFSSNKYIKLRNLLYTPYSQFGGYHYAHGWGLIYWMLHSGEKFDFKGRSFDLKKVFGDFFERNLSQGFSALPGLFGAQSREEYMACADKMEGPWKRYLNSLTPPSVGKFDKKNKRKFVSESVGFALEAPRKSRKANWKFIPELDLGDGELVGLKAEKSSARFVVGQRANANATLNVDKLARDLLPYMQYKYENFKLLKPERLSLKGQPVFVLNFFGRERKTDFNDNPYPNTVRARVLLYLAGKNYFTLQCQTDKDDWDKEKDSFEDVIAGFTLLTQK